MKLLLEISIRTFQCGPQFRQGLVKANELWLWTPNLQHQSKTRHSIISSCTQGTHANIAVHGAVPTIPFKHCTGANIKAQLNHKPSAKYTSREWEILNIAD